ncbi:hypothetical protein BGZ51_000920 [Haplosporangium sp. Z 767]|nr:hypothetical protein BGZ51_000920 [Haplosporangium sp. Z 767]KAF9192641.1 hypothetical protein BGZ50_008348 [Haplosporangium sp. Z 11]
MLFRLSDNFLHRIEEEEALQIIGLQKDHLSTDSQQLLSQITELATLLGLSDTTLSSFQLGQAQLHLDTIHHTQQQRIQKAQLQALESSQRQAQQGLERLLEMKRQWREARETDGDLEQRTRRRSTELNRIKTSEDKELLLRMDETLHQQQRSSQDLEVHELTIAQLDVKEKTIHELQELLESQTKTLSAYYDLPMDYSLANLKLKEATQRFEDLNAEHEAMLTEMANDL